MTAAEPVREREQVVDRVVEPEFDPRGYLAQLDDSLRSLRTAVVLLGLVSIAALGLALYALLRADEADTGDRTSGPSQSEVSQLEDRVETLEDREPADQDSVEKALEDKADAADVTALEKQVSELADQPAPEPAEAEPDPETTQAITDLTERLDELEQRLEEAEAQAP